MRYIIMTSYTCVLPPTRFSHLPLWGRFMQQDGFWFTKEPSRKCFHFVLVRIYEISQFFLIINNLTFIYQFEFQISRTRLETLSLEIVSYHLYGSMSLSIILSIS